MLAIFLLYKRKRNKYNNLPPGPFALPLIGSIPFLKGKGGPVGWMVDKSLYKYGKDFCTIWMGTIPFIWIQDYKLAKELFAKDEFSDRLNLWYFKNVRGSHGRTLGISWESGRFWNEQKRFALKHLKDLGFGKHSLVNVVQEEATDCINTIISEVGGNGKKDILFQEGFFNFPIINILWQIIASKKYNPSSVETQKIMHMLTKFFKQGFPLLDFVPAIRPYVPYSEIDRNVFAIKETIRKQIEEHERTMNAEEEPRDFMDIYLREIEIEKEKLGSSYSIETSSFHVEQLVVMCLDFFSAGTETTGTTLSWATMYLSLNERVQRKCQIEIDECLGGNDKFGTQ